MRKDECIALATKKILADKKKQDEKITKQRDREAKETFRPIAKWRAMFQDEINLIARLIDKGHPCMMCGNPHMKKINGCHYHSRGNNLTLAYNLLNIFHGCNSCNVNRGGNIIGYDTCLIATFGEELWNEVKFDLVREYPRVDLRENDFKEKLPIAREIVRELKKANRIYNSEERIELRDKYNKRLGIYL